MAPPDPTHQDPEARRLAERVEELTARIQELEAVVAASSELQDELTATRARLAETTATLRRLQGRKVVRVGLRLAESTVGMRRSLAAVRRPARALRLRAATRRGLRTVARQRRATAPSSAVNVSIVIPSRDGADRLRPLLKQLRKTHHTAFDITIVDNGSSDDTSKLPSEFADLDIRIVRNEHNATFSEACNQGIEASSGDAVLFMNNDIIPLNRSWLGHMLDELGDDVGAVGALLVYPDADESSRKITVQHRGIRFTWEDGAPRPRNVQHADATDASLLASQTQPAATAACVLVTRHHLDAVEGFSEGYIYGWEDTDLCLKLGELGLRSVVCGMAALVHQEFGTQRELGSAVRAANFRNNASLFHRRWEPELAKRLRRDTIVGDGSLSMRPHRHAAIAVSSTNPSDGFGDLYTGRELAVALERGGWTVELVGRGSDDWGSMSHDVSLIVALLPDFDPSTRPGGAVTVAWIRNWVSRWVDRPSFRHFDLVAVASSDFGDEVTRRTGKSSFLLPLATNPERFNPGVSRREFESDVAFTGNAWGTSGRDLLNSLDLDPGEDFAIWGKNWDRFGWGQEFWRGHLPYEDMVQVYRSTSLVLDDTAEPNVPALNSRVFDALASGTLVISDNVQGSAEIFDGILPTFGDRAELRRHLDTYRVDTDLRQETVSRLQELVLADHTYEQRAARLEQEVGSFLERSEVMLRIGPPSDAVAEQWGDTHFARGFAAALHAKDFNTSVSLRTEWDLWSHQLGDVALHIRGLSPYMTKPSHTNVLWIISHPDDVTLREVERFDLVMTASESFSAVLREKTDTPVVTMLQATNPDIFRPMDPDPTLRCEAVFVGNTRGQRRPIVDWALEAGVDLHVYGSGWDGLIPRSVIKDTYFPNDQLASLYSSAGAVLNDHWPDMASHGFISNRVFDALASGAFVISDAVPGLETLSPGNVRVVGGPADLSAAVADGRDPSAETPVQTMRDHTFEARAAEFADLLAGLASSRN